MDAQLVLHVKLRAGKNFSILFCLLFNLGFQGQGLTLPPLSPLALHHKSSMDSAIFSMVSKLFMIIWRLRAQLGKRTVLELIGFQLFLPVILTLTIGTKILLAIGHNVCC